MLTFDQNTKTLFASTGEVIKQLDCPFPPNQVRLIWQNARQVRCKGCERSLRLAHAYSEAELLQIMQEQPDTCLLVDFRSPDIQIIQGDPNHVG